MINTLTREHGYLLQNHYLLERSEKQGVWSKGHPDAMKRRDTCTPMFIAAMATIAKLRKEPQCPSKGEWIKKMWFMYTMEYYSAFRNDKYPPFSSTWMELEGNMLSEVSQSEEDIHHTVSFIWGI